MEPLDPELRRIIREGLAEAVPGPAAEERVLAGLLAKLPAGGGPGGGPEDGGVGGASSGMTGAAGVKAWWIAGVVAVGVVAATVATRKEEVVPAVIHVSKDRQVAEEREGERGVDAVRGAAEEGASVRASSAETRGVGSDVRRVGSDARREGSPVRVSSGVESDARLEGSEDALRAEARGVAEAEAALGRGEFSAALARLEELARSHPEGQLGLEREAVEICARCGLQEAGAAAAAQEFLTAHADAAVAGKVRARCAEVLRRKLAGP